MLLMNKTGGKCVSVGGPLSIKLCLNLSVDVQFALWVDAVIFVFSLEDEISFQTVYHYFSRLASYRNPADLPLVLVGTQGLTPAHAHTQLHFVVKLFL